MKPARNSRRPQVVQFIVSIRQRESLRDVTGDRWNGRSLEWSTPSPPPVAQIGVHLVFFLHLTTAPDNTNNVLALVFGILIVVLIIVGSIWIMNHLDQRMMPMGQTM